MEVIELNGMDPRLYALTAHLVMDEKVLAYNQNYPFKTSPVYRWFIATKEGKTLGFLPVKFSERKATINNYWVSEDDPVVFKALVEEAVHKIPADTEIESVVQARHRGHFEKCGFRATGFWIKFAKMTHVAHGKECV